MRIETNNLKKVSSYAELCGLKRSAIYLRLDKDTMKAVEIDGEKFIDITKFPPGIRRAGRPKKI